MTDLNCTSKANLSSAEALTEIAGFDAEFVLAEPSITLDPNGGRGRNKDLPLIASGNLEMGDILQHYQEVTLSRYESMLRLCRTDKDIWASAKWEMVDQGGEFERVRETDRTVSWRTDFKDRFFAKDDDWSAPSDAIVREFRNGSRLIVWWLAAKPGKETSK